MAISSLVNVGAVLATAQRERALFCAMPQASGGAGTGIVTPYEAMIQTAEIATAMAAKRKAKFSRIVASCEGVKCLP
jgi:hypothetical protein